TCRYEADEVPGPPQATPHPRSRARPHPRLPRSLACRPLPNRRALPPERLPRSAPHRGAEPEPLPRRRMVDQMKTFTVEVERDEAGYWIATVPEVPGVVTQAKRLENLAGRASEATAVMLDVEESEFELVLHVAMLDDVPYRDARTAREQAETAQTE